MLVMTPSLSELSLGAVTVHGVLETTFGDGEQHLDGRLGG